MKKLFVSSLLLASAFGCSKALEAPTAIISDSGSTKCSELKSGPALHPGVPVAFSGLCSKDPQDSGLTYQWSVSTRPGLSKATILDPSEGKPTFVPEVPGAYEMTLEVSDGTLSGKPVTIKFDVDECGTAAPVPMASTTTKTPTTGEGVALVASATDADNDEACGGSQTFTYEWSFVSVPEGSAATIPNPGAMESSFTPDVPGDYTLALVVTDSSGLASPPVTLDVTVAEPACGEHAPVSAAKLIAPQAIGDCGGADLAINLGGNDDRIQFDASASSDADNAGTCSEAQLLNYSWTILRTPFDAGGFCGGNGCTTTVYPGTGQTAILRTAVAGKYEVRLVVTDSTGRVSNATSCVVNVSNPG